MLFTSSHSWALIVTYRRQISTPRSSGEIRINFLASGLRKQHPDPHKANLKAPEEGLVVMEDFDDGWPGYEEPVFVTH
jgi:hypothetical protein